MTGQLSFELAAAPIEGPWPVDGSLWLRDDRGHRVTGTQTIADGPGREGSRCMVHVTCETNEPHIFDWWPEASFRRSFTSLPDRDEAWRVVLDADGERLISGPEWWTAYLHLPEPRPDDSRVVVCPSCRARAGTFCKRPAGHTSKQSHAARWDAFLAAAVRRAMDQSSSGPLTAGDGRHDERPSHSAITAERG